jgi:hypothetical protein
MSYGLTLDANGHITQEASSDTGTNHPSSAVNGLANVGDTSGVGLVSTGLTICVEL